VVDDESVDTAPVNALLVWLVFDPPQKPQRIFCKQLNGQRVTEGQKIRFIQNTINKNTITIAADADRNKGRESAKKHARAESHEADLEEDLFVIVVVVSLPVPAHKQEAVPVNGDAELHT
jgi:hypothetical protein